MAHVRQQIRNALATVLDGLTTTGSNVFANRVAVLQEDELPALVVTTNAEQIGVIDIHGGLLERTMRVDISAKAKAIDNVDDVLDTIAEEVETVLLDPANNTLNGLCAGMMLVGFEVNLNEDLEMPVGELVMQFDVLYNTGAGAPSVSI